MNVVKGKAKNRKAAPVCGSRKGIVSKLLDGKVIRFFGRGKSGLPKGKTLFFCRVKVEEPFGDKRKKISRKGGMFFPAGETDAKGKWPFFTPKGTPAKRLTLAFRRLI